MSEYDAWADYYDLIHEGVPGEAEFYVGRAIQMKGKTLELGCGTGRIALPMAMSGVDVVGLDNSAAMLRRCQEKSDAVGVVSGRLRLVRADMRRFALKTKFDFIAMPYRAFMHLLDQRAQRECLLCVREHLADDGCFVLNVWVPRFPAATTANEGSLRYAGRYEVPADNLAVVHYCATRYDWHRQLLREEHVLHEVEPDGSLIDTRVLSMVRAWITPREMDNLVRLCGFSVTAVFGNFDCDPLTDRTTEMIWVLQKD